MTPNQLANKDIQRQKLMIYNEQVYYKYAEYISKNDQARMLLQNNEIKVYALVGNPRCLVRLLDQYLERLPPDASFLYCDYYNKFQRNPINPGLHSSVNVLGLTH